MVAARRGGKRVAYARVSSVDQNEARQLDGMDADKTFIDKCSGKDVNRPQLKAALDYLRDGDVLVVHSMDRLARNLGDLGKLVEELTAKGIVVEFRKENLTFTGQDDKLATLMLQMLGAVAQFERAQIRERQLEGIALAKQRGVYTGRKLTMTPDKVKAIRKRLEAGEKLTALAKEFGVTRVTLYAHGLKKGGEA